MAKEKATVQPTEESPQLAAPEGGQPQATSGAEDIQELMNTLKEVGVEKPEQVRNIYTAAQQSGQLANVLGETRQYARQLEQKVSGLEGKIEALIRAQGGTYVDTTQAQGPVNMREEVKRGLLEAAEMMGNQQRQAWLANMEQKRIVEADEAYPLVKNSFEKYVNSPEVQFAIQMGQTTYEREYHKHARSVLMGFARRTRTVLEQINKNQVTPPHVEQGGTQTTPSVAMMGNPTAQESLRNIAKKSRGTDQTIDEMLDVLIPRGDPFLKPTGR